MRNREYRFTALDPPPTGLRGARRCEPSRIGKRRYRSSRLPNPGRINLGDDHSGLLARLGYNLAPRIHDQRMTVGTARSGMISALSSREYPASRLYCPRTQQYVPVRLPCLPGKRRRYADEIRARLRQVRIQRRKTNIVTNREAQSAPRQIDANCAIARLVGIGFAIGFALSQIDIEHMDLVVTSGDRATGIEEKAAIGDPAAVRARRERTDMQPDPQLARERRESRQGTGIAERLAFQLGAVRFDQRHALRKRNEIRALRGSPSNKLCGCVQVGTDLVTGTDLDTGETEKIRHQSRLRGRARTALPQSSLRTAPSRPGGLPRFATIGVRQADVETETMFMRPQVSSPKI